MNNLKPLPGQGLALLSAAMIGGFILAGCTRDPEHQDIPPTKVVAVQAYGQNLDDSATPQQVVYVLLRSIADDVNAAQAHKTKEQKEAFKITHSLAAYSVIEQRLLDVLNTTRPQKTSSLGPDRDMQLYDLIHQWAPIVSHYVRSFETDFNAASQKMSASTTPDQKTTHVLYQAAHDPSATGEARGDVTIDIELVKEPAGPNEYWRVARISYLGKQTRVQPTTRPSAPATSAPH